MNNDHDQNNEIMSAAKFGAYLCHLRKQKNLSLGEVSERLKLPVRQLEALEKGNYEILPEPVFIRGFIRSYASFLDADEEKLNHYLAHFSPPKNIKTETVGEMNYLNKKVSKPFPTWILGLLGLLIIGGIIYAWQSKSTKEHNTQTQKSIASEVMTANNTPSNINASNIRITPMLASDLNAVSAASANANQESSAASATTATTNNEVATAAGELMITARYRTMLTVTNAKGEILISRIVPARSEHRFTDGAPFDVRIGYATGSTVTFNGKTIDVNAYTKNRTATFKTDNNIATIATASAAN